MTALRFQGGGVIRGPQAAVQQELAQRGQRQAEAGRAFKSGLIPCPLPIGEVEAVFVDGADADALIIRNPSNSAYDIHLYLNDHLRPVKRQLTLQPSGERFERLEL